MAAEIPFTAVMLASLLGAILGWFTGLVPGLHSNNVASAVGSRPGLILAIAAAGSGGPEAAGWELVASAAVVACAVAHTVSNIVPSIFFAVPEGGTALSVLPGHRMVKAGMGNEALRVSVISSLAALVIAVALVVPIHAIMGPPVGLVHALRDWIGPALLTVSFLMVLREAGKPAQKDRPSGIRAGLAATAMLLTSGALGHVVLFSDGMVAPIFIGLFGVPTVLLAIVDHVTLDSGEERPSNETMGHLPWSPILKGTLAGSVVGWFPGVSSAQATILVATGGTEGEDGDLEGARRFIAGVSAVNTTNVVFNIVALATLLRVRSGAASAISSLMAWSEPPWGPTAAPSSDVAFLLMAAMVGGLVAAPLTLSTGRWLQRALPYISNRWTLGALILVLVGATVLAGGPEAGLVLLVSSALGLIPPILGLMRVHLMGVVTLPLALGLVLG